MKQSTYFLMSLAGMAASIRLSSNSDDQIHLPPLGPGPVMTNTVTCPDGTQQICFYTESIKCTEDNYGKTCDAHMGTSLAQTATNSDSDDDDLPWLPLGPGPVLTNEVTCPDGTQQICFYTESIDCKGDNYGKTCDAHMGGNSLAQTAA